MIEKYTIIKNNKVVNIIDADEAFILKNFNNDIVYKGEIPLGWEVNDSKTKAFKRLDTNLDSSNFVSTDRFNAEYIIRSITRRAFMQRFTLEERIAIRASTDPIVIDIQEDLNSASKVDLGLPELRQGLMYLLSVGLLATPERVDELLVNGNRGEAYE